MTFNRSLFFTIVGLLGAVLFIPLFVSNSLFFPFITGKNFAFRIIVELAALAWVILMLRDRDYRPKFSWLTIAIAVFVLIVGVADVLSSNPIKSFLSNFERMEGWITIAHLFVYYLMLVTIFRTWTFWKRFFQVSLGVSAIICIHGFMQLAGSAAIHQSSSRLDASFGNATYLAVYMLFHVFIALILLVRHLRDRVNDAPWYQDFLTYTYLVMIVVQSIILFFTATRGSILGLIGGLIVAAIFIAITERENKNLRKISIGVLAVIIVLIGSFILARNTSFVKNNEVLSRFSSISINDNTTKARFLIWNMAWQGVTQDAKHFTIGWGQESFNYIFAQYYDPRMYAQEQWFDRSHNVFFDWLTSAGILGLLSYLSIFGFTLFSVWKSQLARVEKSLITGLLAGYFFHNLFVFDNLVSYVVFFIVVAYAGYAATPETVYDRRDHESRELGQVMQYTGIVLASAAFIFVFYQYTYKPIAANLALMNALRPTQVAATGSNADYVYTEENIDSFKKALAYNTTGLYETREQIFDLAAKAYRGNSEASVKQGLVQLAQTEAVRQQQETPNDVRYYTLAGGFYQNIGDYKNADINLTKAVSLTPQKQSLLFLLGSNQFSLKQYTDALATFKKAYELDSTFDEAKKLYALVAFYAGQEKITTDLFGTGPVMDARFLLAYKNTKRYTLMIAYLEKNVAEKPLDIQAHLALASGYVTVGNRTKAVATLQTVKTLTNDESAKTQLDGWIKDIQAGKNPFETAQK